jgi:glucose dehydrogenase
MNDETPYDVVIVGAGVVGALMAYKLGSAGKKVLLLDGGAAVPDSRTEYLENFYLARAKTPEAPYPALPNSPPAPLFPLPDPALNASPRPTILQLGAWKDPSQSYLVQPQTPTIPSIDKTGAVRKLPFASTYERVGGGTTWHWLGTSLRNVPDDLTMFSTYDVFGPGADWPITYAELQPLYALAEAEIGVSASVDQQQPLAAAIGLTFPEGYNFPLNPIPTSLVDQAVSTGISGLTVPSGSPTDPRRYDVFVTPTPAGRNSQPYQGRRVCAGNTNCIPICPIQAKWDATVTLAKALNTGNVTVSYNSVASRVQADSTGTITGIQYLVYQGQLAKNSATPVAHQVRMATGKAYVLAAHAMENAKLLLMSKSPDFPEGIANKSDQVGRNLMDHVLLLTWALMPEGQPVFPYRGPLSTAGIECLRNGDFRRTRSAFRIEIGNEGWNFAAGDPYTTVNDFITGTNISQLNPKHERLGGLALVNKLNDLMTRQFRLVFLMDQAPDPENRITLHPTLKDGLGLPRPQIAYGLDEYTLNGFRAAREVSLAIYERLGATDYTNYTNAAAQPGYFVLDGEPCQMFGAGHVVGTHRMGADRTTSVVDANQRAHDHPNLWIAGSGSFPTVATANPTLTLLALSFKAADSVLASLS